MSELTAIVRLIENGYVVYEATTRESHDLLALDPVTDRYLKAQVKTVYRREDRKNTPVIYAKKANGQAYSHAEADVIIGVDGRDVYIVPNREIGEYWKPKGSSPLEWRLLPEGDAEQTKETGASA